MNLLILKAKTITQKSLKWTRITSQKKINQILIKLNQLTVCTFFHVCIVKAIWVTIQNDSPARRTWYLIKSQHCHILLDLSLPRHNLVSLMIQFLFYNQTVRWERGYACPGWVQDCNKKIAMDDKQSKCRLYSHVQRFSHAKIRNFISNIWVIYGTIAH